MSNKTPHTGCWPGKRVRVVLRDGTTFIDKFKERTNKHVFFFSHPRVPRADISSFTIYKPNPALQ